jgi:tetratricopeptide (TPR) repeat protein
VTAFAWGPTAGEETAPPAATAALLDQAIALHPGKAALHAKRGYLLLDCYDFAGAGAAFEEAARLEPGDRHIARLLARCRNMVGRHESALAALAPFAEPEFERGEALTGLGQAEAAEAEYRAVLSADPFHHHAARKLLRGLRRANRIAALLAECEALAAAGVRHTQLLYYWGWALALTGEEEKARRILFDPSRVVRTELALPPGFADRAAFNRALAEELTSNPHRLGEFPLEDEANRGSRRVESLFAGRNPGVIRLTLAAIQDAVAVHLPPPYAGFDPWCEARPHRVHLKAWGLIQRAGDYEEWHIHRGGWLSGVYYVDIPAAVSPEGPGCIEYGPPPGLGRSMPDLVQPWRFAPHEGALLLAPSHYPHRTIPLQGEGLRLSFAFDVVPEDRRLPA